MLRPFLLLALALSAFPAVSQAQVNAHGEEAFVMGNLRQRADDAFRTGDLVEARETCRELLGYIDSVRTVTPGELAERRDWAKQCADGSYQPQVRRVEPLSKTGNYLDLLITQAVTMINDVRADTPYDDKKDTRKVLQRSQAAASHCWNMEEDAVRFGQGSLGIAKYCQGAAQVLGDNTIKPKKKHYYCHLFRKALEDFAQTDIAASRWSSLIEAAKLDSEKMMASAQCQQRR